nr:MAG TPA: hypothetical protein [Caudoviricetes sp.]
MIHLYENHLGGWYTLDRYEEPDYCETCREFDEYIGAFQSMEDVALKLLKEDASDEEIHRVTGLKVIIKFGKPTISILETTQKSTSRAFL